MFGAIRQYFPWLATSLVSLLLILSNDNPQVQSLRGSISDLAVLGAAPLNSVIKIPMVWRENRHLRRQLTQMSLEVARLGQMVIETGRLKRMLGFTERSRHRLVIAEVVGMNPDQGVRGLLLNRGTSDGIEKEAAVIVPEGVAGKVHRVGRHSAQVQLLTDANIGVAVRLRTTRENGIVHAAGSGNLRLDGIPVTAEVVLGDSVVTSGLGGVFPENLPVGVVSQVSTAAEGWLLEVQVTPFVDFARLEEVFVVAGAKNGS